jgi:hypothetical protein
VAVERTGSSPQLWVAISDCRSHKYQMFTCFLKKDGIGSDICMVLDVKGGCMHAKLSSGG